jgi:hypothetical protein
MPYISKNESKEIKKRLQAKFPDFKFSVRIQHCTSLNVDILSGPLLLELGRGYEQVNHYAIEKHYANTPYVRDFLLAVKDCIFGVKEVTSEHYDSDYGSISTFYLHISIGRWDKPFLSTVPELPVEVANA